MKYYETPLLWPVCICHLCILGSGPLLAAQVELGVIFHPKIFTQASADSPRALQGRTFLRLRDRILPLSLLNLTLFISVSLSVTGTSDYNIPYFSFAWVIFKFDMHVFINSEIKT
jgi:hypothetical protein